ncbi:hypothetical protein [Thermococcus nautili]|uniref:Uncharacterized protein n=1 Tax=Thermococcus nautili TaxID=195522 RepID=W8NSY2_9EURY|nr:hypothetical protein [Thermococcus nautili]AHL22353.1 hypothetical protein BD01_0730 [Thermococcus nautili]
MKKLQIIILAIILAFIIVGSISHSYANAETVWRSNNQFAVVSTSKYVVFNISNVTIINFPKNAQDIDIAIYATVGVLNSSHILKVEAVLYEPHSKRAFFVISPQGSRDIILNSTISYGHLNHWNVVLCENDMCSRPLEIGFILKNVTLTGTTVYIDYAYAVLVSNSANMSLLVPEKNPVHLVVAFTEDGKRVVKNYTFIPNENGEEFNVSSGSTNSTNSRSYVGAGLLLTWILLLILLPTIAFLFSDSLLNEKGRTALFSFGGVFVYLFVPLSLAKLFHIRTLMGIWIWIIYLVSVSFLILLSGLQEIPYEGVVSLIVTFILTSNVALLLWVGVNPGDFAILIWVFSMVFGAGITFVLIWNRWETILLGALGILLIVLLSMVTSLFSINFITYGLALLALVGYGLVFVQALIKTTVGRGESNDILDTFYNLIIGAFIVPSSLIFAYAITNGMGLSDNTVNTLVQQFQSVVILYLGITLTSVLLLWEESQENLMLARFLTLQNVISMLLIVLGGGMFVILGVNFGMTNNNTDIEKLLNWAMSTRQNMVVFLISILEGIGGLILLILSNLNRNQRRE